MNRFPTGADGGAVAARPRGRHRVFDAPPGSAYTLEVVGTDEHRPGRSRDLRAHPRRRPPLRPGEDRAHRPYSIATREMT